MNALQPGFVISDDNLRPRIGSLPRYALLGFQCLLLPHVGFAKLLISWFEDDLQEKLSAISSFQLIQQQRFCFWHTRKKLVHKVLFSYEFICLHNNVKWKVAQEKPINASSMKIDKCTNSHFISCNFVLFL